MNKSYLFILNLLNTNNTIDQNRNIYIQWESTNNFINYKFIHILTQLHKTNLINTKHKLTIKGQWARFLYNNKILPLDE